MGRYTFRNHQIKRTCNKEYKDYHSYLPYLLEDFSHHCCYCNISEKTLDISSFQIDHFIPQHAFKGVRDELLTQYNNLMLCCPKCNRTKSDLYDGDILSYSVENDLFYNPDTVDYNSIFYRNELGGISSDDEKGKRIIQLLRLYRPLHNYAWVLEKLDAIITQLEAQIEHSSGERKERLKALQEKLMAKYYRMRTHFVVAYRQS